MRNITEKQAVIGAIVMCAVLCHISYLCTRALSLCSLITSLATRRLRLDFPSHKSRLKKSEVVQRPSGVCVCLSVCASLCVCVRVRVSVSVCV